MSLLSYIFGCFGDEEAGGSEDVVAALIESRDDRNLFGCFGEPRLVERGTFVTEHEIEIPIHAEVPVAPLRFELEGNAVDEFIEAYSLTIDSIGDIKGESVAIRQTRTGYVAEW